MAAVYDPMLGNLRSKDVATVDNVQGLSQTLQGDLIVRVADTTELDAIQSPNPLLVYITNDTDDVYLYIPGAGFVNKTGAVVMGNKIFVRNINDLIDVIYDYSYNQGWSVTQKLPTNNVYDVIVPKYQYIDAETYKLVVCDSVSHIRSRRGWAPVVFPNDGTSPFWNWYNYSITGHSHQISDIAGLAEIVQSVYHSYTIDFQTACETVQERNLSGAITITKVVADNVAQLAVSVNGTAQTLTLSNGVWEGSISVADNSLLVWNIARTTNNAIAEINVLYNSNNSNN